MNKKNILLAEKEGMLASLAGGFRRDCPEDSLNDFPYNRDRILEIIGEVKRKNIKSAFKIKLVR